ncbi:hypothetical protein J1N35_039402 [Gossypium stocksii]|uniref:Alcohol dehydrogenase-like C-terminal domain-containing protein n=1 Tax=Gossypium stocksii TaxID=47602 RepID=A0A9D3ZNK3_9ROSI|nr:hypothetical protein J1N35_039402 [Gossypium stocksii]
MVIFDYLRILYIEQSVPVFASNIYRVVHGGSSGIGTFAIQVAKNKGATVLFTAESEEKLAFCKKLGADMCINYKREDFVARAMEETGGKGTGGAVTEIKLNNLLPKRLTVQGAALRPRSTENRAMIVSEVKNVWPAVAAGKAGEAHRIMESSEHIGKILLVP